MNTLTDAERDRLAGCLALAEEQQNPHAGERIAALAAAERLLARRGFRLRDLVVPLALPAPLGTGAQSDLEVAIAAFPTLTEWEQNFVISLRRFRQLSEKQRHVLAKIAQKVSER
jgi:hypothetical protein